MDFQEFIDITLGRRIDTDGFPKEQPYQCVDLAKYFNECYNPGFQIYCTKTGYAKDWATEKYTNGILDHFKETEVNNMIKGTLVIWGNSKQCPYSHIGFFVKDNENGTFQCLQQNAPYPYVTLSNMRYEGIIGAFIPNQLLHNISVKDEYINIPGWIELRNIYNSAGVQIATIKPKKFGGLTYKILGYQDYNGKKFAKIKTVDFGDAYVMITNSTPITDYPIYGHGNY